MARQQTVTGIDIGTSLVKVIIAEAVVSRGRLIPKIIGTGTCESRGVSRGYITNQSEAARSVEIAVKRAEKACGTKIKRAYVSFGGIGLSSIITEGTIAISRADLEITERDLSQVLEKAEASIPRESLLNKKVINTVPIEYSIDGKPAWGQVVGLKAQKLEVKALFITCLEHHLSTLISTVESSGVEVADVVAGPVAASFVTLSKKQKMVGCLLADFGAETLSIVVYENSNLISLEVFPVGSADITNDIALGLKISLEDAEKVKLDLDRQMMYSKKKLEDIVVGRLKDAFDQINKHLKSIGRDSLLPGGSILTGRGSSISGIKQVAENVLSLPSQLSDINFGNDNEGRIKDRTWAIACGLVIVGLNASDEQSSLGVRNTSLLREGGKRWFKTLSRWISQFLP